MAVIIGEDGFSIIQHFIVFLPAGAIVERRGAIGVVDNSFPEIYSVVGALYQAFAQ